MSLHWPAIHDAGTYARVVKAPIAAELVCAFQDQLWSQKRTAAEVAAARSALGWRLAVETDHPPVRLEFEGKVRVEPLEPHFRLLH